MSNTRGGSVEPLEGEFNIRGIAEAIKELKELKDETEELGEEAKKAGGGWGSLSDRITAGVVSVRAAWDAVTGLLGAMRDATVEFERQTAVINRFSGDISNASQRVNGLIADIDLMVQSNKAAQAGLELTGEQLGTLAVRASEWAAATGQDATEAFDKLMVSVSTGEEGPLKELGVSLEGLTTKQQRQESAIRQLTEGYEDATSEADSFAGMLLTLGTRLENAQTEMIGAAEQSGLLDQAMENLGNATDQLIEKFGIFGDDSDGPLSDVEHFTITGAAMLTAFTERIEATMTVFSSLIDMRERIAAGDLGGAVDIYGDAKDAFDMMRGENGQGLLDRIQALRAEGVANAIRSQEEGGSGPMGATSGGTRSGARAQSRDLGDGPGDSISAYEFQNDLLEAQREIQAEIAENQQLKADAAAEEIRRAKERNRLAEEELEMNAALKAEEAERHEAQLKADAKREKALRGQHRMQRGAEEFAGLIQNTLELAAEGQDNLGKSFVTMIDEWLKSFAIQEAYKGAAAFAEGIGNAVMNTGHAAAKFAEAAQHFALAAVAGGASAAIPNQGGGASAGGGAGAGAGPANTGRDSGGGGGGTVVVNVNAPVAEEYLGRMTARSQRAAQNRFRG